MSPEPWNEWLAEFKQRFIEANKWTEKEAKLRIRDAWAIVRDGRVHILESDDQRPADAVPVFLTLTPGGWKLPIWIEECLTGLVEKAISSNRSPHDIVLGLLSRIEHPDGQDESDEIKQKRDSAAFWGQQLLDACEDKTLSGVVDSDVFWQAVLAAFLAGRRLTILDLYRDPQTLANLIKAEAFQGGRSPDELTRRLRASYIELRSKSDRRPKPQEVAKAAGGKWSNCDACWQFGDRLISHDALCQRLKDIRGAA